MTIMERTKVKTVNAALNVEPVTVPEKYWLGERTNLLRQIAKTYYLATMVKQLNIPTPRDDPKYRSRAPRAYKVLLVGNGPTHGWGVATHGLALTGQIAQNLGSKIKYGVDLDYVGEEIMSASATVGFLGNRDVSVYDLVVLVLSLNDALRLTPVDDWENSVNDTLRYLRNNRNPGAKMLVIGIQQADSAVGYRGNPFGALAQRHVNRLNARMQAAVEARGDEFALLSPPFIEPGLGIRSKETYAHWGDEISSRLVKLLPPRLPDVQQLPETVWERPALEKALGRDGVDRAAKLRDIASRAKRAFLTPVAYVTVVDHGQQYTPTATGSMAAELPVDMSYCKYTVEQDEPVIYENALKHEHFAGNGYVDVVNMPFYAGKSLTSEDGKVIGTFCVMGPLPKSEKRFAMAKFLKFATEAEDALREIEAGA